jgi:hypothetical protein
MRVEARINGEEAVTSALRAIKDALFTLGAEGDECIQRLVSAQAALSARDPGNAPRKIVRAFQRGMDGDAKLAPSPGQDAPEERAAHAVGQRAMQLNKLRRAESGLNIGPFDTPSVQAALERVRKLAE